MQNEKSLNPASPHSLPALPIQFLECVHHEEWKVEPFALKQREAKGWRRGMKYGILFFNPFSLRTI
jgi:hypothetical protein